MLTNQEPKIIFRKLKTAVKVKDFLSQQHSVTSLDCFSLETNIELSDFVYSALWFKVSSLSATFHMILEHRNKDCRVLPNLLFKKIFQWDADLSFLGKDWNFLQLYHQQQRTNFQNLKYVLNCFHIIIHFSKGSSFLNMDFASELFLLVSSTKISVCHKWYKTLTSKC